MKELFIEAKSRVSLLPATKAALPALKRFKAVGLVSTVQHCWALKGVKKFLEQQGKKVFIGKPGPRCQYAGQVLGCDVGAAQHVQDIVNCFVYIGTGQFHPLGVAVETDKPVLVLNPFTKKVSQITERQKRTWLNKKYIALAKVKTAKSLGILVSTKPGQYQLKKALKLKKCLEGRGQTAAIFMFDTLDANELLNFLDIEAWINTACPRIPDDQELFKRPIVNAEDLSI